MRKQAEGHKVFIVNMLTSHQPSQRNFQILDLEFFIVSGQWAGVGMWKVEPMGESMKMLKSEASLEPREHIGQSKK